MPKEFNDLEFDEMSCMDERNFDDNYSTCTVCAQCGYRFSKYDEAIRIKSTDDVIHRDCWIDYSDENVNELCEQVIL